MGTMIGDVVQTPENLRLYYRELAAIRDRARAIEETEIRRIRHMNRHYHVFAGTVGCLQDGDATFKLKKDAEQYAVEEANVYREMGFKVSGNVKDGYSIDPINTLYVSACCDPNCDLWQEYNAN